MYGQTNYKIINGKKEEIILYKKIAQIIHSDTSQRENNNFKLKIVNPIYGPVYGEETKNAIVWLFLENFSSKQFTKIVATPPIIKLFDSETNNIYLVEIIYNDDKFLNTSNEDYSKIKSFRHYDTTVNISYFSEIIN